MKTVAQFFLLIISFLLLFFGCEKQDSQSLSEIFDDSLDVILNSTITQLNAPGVELYIRFSDSSIWHKASGSAKLANNSSYPMELNMQFRIGSVTKTFIGTSILQLVKQNKVKLSDTVEELLPNTITNGNKLTVQMLLNHTSSLVDYATLDSFEEIYIDSLEKEWSADEIFSYVTDKELQDTPGNIAYYSNTNYYLLGLIIEKESGLLLTEYLSKNIFEPLNLDNTYFPSTNKLSGNFSDGYFDYNENGHFESDEIVTNQNPTAIWAAGMIVSDVVDLSIWLNELMEGTLLNSQLQKVRMNFNNNLHGAPDFVKMGLGVASIEGAVGHTGAVPGYTTILFRYKDHDIIAYSNCFHTIKGSVAEQLFQKVKDFIDRQM